MPLSIALAVALVGAGCHHQGSYVFVNVDAAVMPSMGRTTAPAQPGLPAVPETTAKFSLPALPAVTDERNTGAGAAKVQKAIEVNRERTFKLIVRRLQIAYKREAADLKSKQLAAFEPVRAGLVSEALDSVSKAYVTYANSVGPKIARLAVNAGFPDPDPKGRRKPSGLEGLDTLAYQTSEKLRTDIAALKADFKRYSDATLSAAYSNADAKLTDLLAEVARQVGDVDARAQDVARSEVSHAQAQLGPLLADQPPTPLPATQGSSVVVSSGSQPAVVANVGDRQAALAGDDVNRVKQDLDIWLAVNNYIQRPKGRARDATAEFIEWRNRFRQEPSASH
jgi:hypothetical protein